jgi:hypothetical protein
VSEDKIEMARECLRSIHANGHPLSSAEESLCDAVAYLCDEVERLRKVLQRNRNNGVLRFK